MNRYATVRVPPFCTSTYGKTILEKRSLAEYLRTNWETLREQLQKFTEEVRPR